LEIKETEIKNILSTVLEVNLEDINEGLEQSTHSSWDSMKHLILISAFEDEFEITLTDDEVVNMTTYSAIINTIRKHKDE